jgi:maltose alpha-D-glucosyltransferase / alpha-amylase
LELEKFKLKKAPTLFKQTDWADRPWAYAYVDKVGIRPGESGGTFEGMIQNLDYYQKELGIENLYLMPINKSPKRDGGYDVSDYKGIDELIGGNEGFEKLIKAAKGRGMNIMIDFVPGHTSREHEWFKRVLRGEQKYKNYYLNTLDIPPHRTIKDNSGNYYNIYQEKNGKEYKRLLLFPDIEKEHWHKEADGVSYYSSFYPFQKDLNLQNPDVLQEHLSTLSHWISLGVGGIRADAISWWVKTPGTTGQHLDETFAISEYFHLFLKYMDKESLFLPELVDSPETAIKYLGKSANLNGAETGQNADAVFEFEKVVQIFYAGLTGDFKSHHDFLKRYRKLKRPKKSHSILYTGNHHDEIYLGFLPLEARKEFQKRVNQSGGIVYKGGNSAGAMVSDLFRGDEAQILQFYQFLFSHHGAIAVFQGSELGLKNAWKETYLTTFKQVALDIQEGRIKASDPVVKEIEKMKMRPSLLESPPLESSALYPFIDGRLLHRHKISQELFDTAKEGGNTFFKSFTQLLKLREKSLALSRGGIEEPLESLRSHIGSFMRRFRDGEGNIQDEVAVVKNGRSGQEEVNLSLSQLTQKESFKIINLETGKEYPYVLNHEKGFITIRLRAHQGLWLQVVNDPL